MTTPTTRWPVDYDAIKKGDIIDEATCESVCGCNSEDKNFSLKLLAFKQTIEREMFGRGRPVTIRCEKSTIRILTDDEASEYNEQQQKSALRQFARSHERNMHVDVANLDDNQKILHDRRLLMGGCLLSAITKTRTDVRVQFNQTERPKLTG